MNGEQKQMNDFKTVNVQTTLGELITVLSEEARPFLRNEKETSLVVSYIFNDLIRKSGSGAYGRETQRPRRERVRSAGTEENGS